MAEKDKHLISPEELLSVSMDRERYIRLAMIYVRNAEDAEDIFHDCLLEILNNMDRIHLSDIKSYFTASVKHRSLRHIKRQLKSEAWDPSATNDPIIGYYISKLQTDGEEDTVKKTDFARLYNNCKRKLSVMTLAVFESKRLHKMSYKKIAQHFGISENKVNFELRKALKVFRKEFRNYRIFMIAAILLV